MPRPIRRARPPSLSRSVPTVESDSVCRAEIAGSGGESAPKEVLAARRVGGLPAVTAACEPAALRLRRIR